MDKNVYDALIKKATGYTARESVEEYIPQENSFKLLKRKVKTKQVPPDMSALKVLISMSGDVGALSDEQLQSEKMRLIKLLEQTENKKGE